MKIREWALFFGLLLIIMAAPLIVGALVPAAL